MPVRWESISYMLRVGRANVSNMLDVLLMPMRKFSISLSYLHIYSHHIKFISPSPLRITDFVLFLM